MRYFKNHFALLLFLMYTVPAFSLLNPENLRCENNVNPLGINVSNPLLSWSLVSQERNQLQTAYEIIVDDNLADAQQQKGKTYTCR